MLILLSLLAAAPIQQDSGAAKPFYRAIWNDLKLNDLIGNGNLRAAQWYDAGSETVPNLHIRELICS